MAKPKPMIRAAAPDQSGESRFNVGDGGRICRVFRCIRPRTLTTSGRHEDSRYRLRGRTEDDAWHDIGLPCGHLSACIADADRFLHHYVRIEIIDRITNRVVHQATRKPIG